MSHDHNSDDSPFDEFFHLHPDVLRLKRHASPDWIEKVEVIQVQGGYTLYCFPFEDFHMLRSPIGMWRPAYFGQDQSFNREVLEQKYGLTYLCDVSAPQLFDSASTQLYI